MKISGYERLVLTGENFRHQREISWCFILLAESSKLCKSRVHYNDVALVSNVATVSKAVVIFVNGKERKTLMHDHARPASDDAMDDTDYHDHHDLI
jgi:hypothetical protein